MVGERIPISKMSVTIVAVDASVGERALRARLTIATSLATDMCYVTPTNFMACFT